MPGYLTLFDGSTGLRTTHLDNLSYVSSLTYGNTGISNLNNSFFFRTQSLWNSIPYNIKNLPNPTEFSTELTKFFWTQLLESGESESESDLSGEFDLSSHETD